MWPFDYFEKKRERAEEKARLLREQQLAEEKRRREEEERKKKLAEEQRQREEEQRKRQLKEEQEKKRRTSLYNNGERITSEISGDKLIIRVPTKYGCVKVVAETVVDPDGDRAVIYEGYSIATNEQTEHATDINYYLGKMQTASNGINNGESWEKVIEFMMSQHISQHGRIIDTDLMMICSALYLILKANKMSDISLLTIQKRSILIARQNFLQEFFVTQIRMTPMGMAPYLVKASSYFRTTI